MTNKEILQSSLLDIIFENRNKDYGAYALRRDYNHRLLIAMGAAASVILLFILINVLGKKDGQIVPTANNNNSGIEIRQIELPKETEKPKEVTKPKPVQKIAQIQYVSAIKIKPDDLVKTTVPDIKELGGKIISTQTLTGTPDDGKVKLNNELILNSGISNTKEPAQAEIIIEEKDPEFLGGPEALKRFLGTNLNTPGNLEAGEKKMVRIRFKVDKDGVVSLLEIISSGGSEFDREVIRVCKKMPRWKPAIQNGINVPVNYVLPVTFIGVEQ